MATFVMVPGAGGSGWYWNLVASRLERAGHRATAVDLPGADEHAALPEYTRLVVDAIGDASDVVLAAQSLGGFTAAMVCATTPVRALVLLNAMIPVPGETPGAWWGNVGAVEAREAAAATGGYGDFDEVTYFLHDVPAAVVAESGQHQGAEADAVFASPCEFDAWPAIPIRVAAGADDRFFPLDFQRRVARERLGLAVDSVPGGHLAALSHPDAVAAYLEGAI
ncbi:MAG TPA: alpha/beta hydrolase family protein [Acidimicrobiia bacterium]|jgi:pimeloyl-ACP methyl ester carboxylesterase|nr:alpha/beta hydrolase family protein [Acidimicrobiia bacterium]